MKKDITQKKSGLKNEKVVAPSQITLDYLKQFARTYYSDKKLAQQYNSIILN